MKNITRVIADLAVIHEVQAIYLFGSAARGKTHSRSDIDICVIGTISVADSLLSVHYSGYDIVSFWDLPLSIRFRVFKEGKALFVKDKVMLNTIKLQTLKAYFDFKPLIDRYCQERFGCMT